MRRFLAEDLPRQGTFALRGDEAVHLAKVLRAEPGAAVLVFDGLKYTETNIWAGQVLREVQALPEAQRETVFLVYVEGMTYREAAGVLAVPIGTVMSRLAAARAKLAGMGDEVAGPPAEGSGTHGRRK